VWTVTYHQELGGHATTHPREDFDRRGHPLHGAEIRDMYQKSLAGWRQLSAQRRYVAPMVSVAIDEIRNDVDVACHAELAKSIGLQGVGHGRDSIGLLDAERYDLLVGPVRAEQRNVRAVQRRDDAGHRQIVA